MRKQMKKQAKQQMEKNMQKQTWQRLILQKFILVTSTLGMLTILGGITGCASNNLNAPCPDYGAYCTKTPLNGWNTNDA